MLLLFFSQFHVPVSQVNEVLPAFVLVHAEVDLYERTPLGPLWFADQVHGSFLRRVIGFARIARNAGADNVFPSGRPAAVARDDVVQVQILPVKSLAAILALVVVAFENVVPGELDFLFGHPVKHDEQDDARDADSERNGVDALGMRLLLGQILPLVEAEGLEGAVIPAEDSLGVPFKEQSQCPPGSADIDRLPQTIQNEHVLV